MVIFGFACARAGTRGADDKAAALPRRWRRDNFIGSVSQGTLSSPAATIVAAVELSAQCRFQATGCRSRGWDRPSAAEFQRLRKPIRRCMSCLRALTKPLPQIGLGPHPLTQLPGETIDEAKHLGIGEAAVLVALQDDSRTTRHFRHLLQREYQQAPVFTDQRHMIAIGGHAECCLFLWPEVHHL